MFSIKHLFVTPKTDGPDTTIVRPSNWNDEHNVVASTGGVLIGRAAGAGAGPMQEIPLNSTTDAGIIQMFAGATPPAGYLLCNGQSVLRATYPALFTAIGTLYGSVDATHFNVPDLQGRVVAMVGGGWALGQAVGGGNRQPRVYGNVYSVTDAFGIGGTTGGESHGVSGLAFGGGGYAADSHTHGWGQSNITVAVNGSITNNGNNVTDAFDVVQATTAMNFIIKT